MYSGIIIQTHMGKMDYWCRQIDDLDTVMWRPYLRCEAWLEDDGELPYMFCPHWMIGHSTFVIKRFFFHRIFCQYGHVQDMPQGIAMYAHVQAERSLWGPCVDFGIAIQEIQEIGYHPWAPRSHIMDASITDEYGAQLHRYPFPRFTNPTERILTIEDLLDGDDSGGDDGASGDGGDDEKGGGHGRIRGQHERRVHHRARLGRVQMPVIVVALIPPKGDDQVRDQWVDQVLHQVARDPVDTPRDRCQREMDAGVTQVLLDQVQGPPTQQVIPLIVPVVQTTSASAPILASMPSFSSCPSSSQFVPSLGDPSSSAMPSSSIPPPQYSIVQGHELASTSDVASLQTQISSIQQQVSQMSLMMQSFMATMSQHGLQASSSQHPDSALDRDGTDGPGDSIS